MDENGAMVTYVVQVRREVEWDDGNGDMVPAEAWRDLPAITVAARTKHKTVMRKALAENGIFVPEEGLLIRLLDPEAATPTRVLPPVPTPGQRELRL